MTDGSRANSSGRSAENVIASVLEQRNLSFDRQVNIGLGIYETPTSVDFFVHNHPDFPHGLIIESKWQDTGGSVDEKFPFLVRNILERFPCPTIIVLHGSGYREGAARWLRRQVGGFLYAVMSLDELMSFIFRGVK